MWWCVGGGGVGVEGRRWRWEDEGKREGMWWWSGDQPLLGQHGGWPACCIEEGPASHAKQKPSRKGTSDVVGDWWGGGREEETENVASLLSSEKGERSHRRESDVIVWVTVELHFIYERQKRGFVNPAHWENHPRVSERFLKKKI